MKRIGFLGAGKMAQALMNGFLKAGLVKPENVIASCIPQDVASIDAFKKFNSKLTFENIEVVQNSDVIILAVKPNVVSSVLSDIKPYFRNTNLLLSIAMGVTIGTLEKNLPEKSKVIRVMPNIPALVQQGTSVFVPGKYATEEDIDLTKVFFQSVGTCDLISEYLLDTATALSGSGPAYALADGAVRMGMQRDLAYKLAAQTVLGAAQMVLTTKEHPGKLKDDVTSPAGSTAEGLYVLENAGVRAAFIRTIETVTNKCKQTSGEYK